MLKDMIKSILKGDDVDIGAGGQRVDADSNTFTIKKKPSFFDKLKGKAHGSKTPAGKEALIALGEEE